MSAIRCARCEQPSVARVQVWVVQDSAISPVVPRDYCATHLAEARADQGLRVTDERAPVEAPPDPSEQSVIDAALRQFIRNREYLDPMKGGSSSFYTTPQEAEQYRQEITIARTLLGD